MDIQQNLNSFLNINKDKSTRDTNKYKKYEGYGKTFLIQRTNTHRNFGCKRTLAVRVCLRGKPFFPAWRWFFKRAPDEADKTDRNTCDRTMHRASPLGRRRAMPEKSRASISNTTRTMSELSTKESRQTGVYRSPQLPLSVRVYSSLRRWFTYEADLCNFSLFFIFILMYFISTSLEQGPTWKGVSDCRSTLWSSLCC